MVAAVVIPECQQLVITERGKELHEHRHLAAQVEEACAARADAVHSGKSEFAPIELAKEFPIARRERHTQVLLCGRDLAVTGSLLEGARGVRPDALE
jgi:hypothetical protein